MVRIIKPFSNSKVTVATAFFFTLLSSFAGHTDSEIESYNEKCVRKFLVFDVGSSTTKSTLYTKDICDSKKVIERQIINENYPYQACLSEAGTNKLPQKCITEGAQVINRIKETFQLNCDDDAGCVALATGWARYTENINDWMAEVSKTSVTPVIASQDYEGELKLHSISSKLGHNSFLAFDIGGGSFQIGWFDARNKMSQYSGLYGTDNFTHDIQKDILSSDELGCIKARTQLLIENKEKNSDKKLETPNQCKVSYKTTIPLNKLDQALSIADEKVGKKIRADKKLQEFVKKNKPTMYADSLLFSLGLKKQIGLNKDVITLSDIESVMKKLAGMTYDQVKETYPSLPEMCINTTQPSMIILYTIMKNLNLNEIHIVQTDYMEHFVNSQIDEDNDN